MKKQIQSPHNTWNQHRQRAIPAGKVLVDQKVLDQARTDRAYIHRMMNMEVIRKIAGVDGYSNTAAFIGGASPLFSGGTIVRSNLTRDYTKLTDMYRGSALSMRIIDEPAEDMTRAWYTLTGKIDPEELEDLKRLEARHNIRGELTDAIRWARLYGGSLALMVISGEEKRLSKPLDLEGLLPFCFQGLLILDRTLVSPSLDIETDLNDPDYSLPMYYEVQTQDGKVMKLHHSRVLRFTGRELPQTEMINENYWGASELEHAEDEIIRYETFAACIAEMGFSANLKILKMDNLGESISMGTDEAKRKLESMLSTMAHTMSSTSLLCLNQDETLETRSYSFEGMEKIHEALMMDAAGAAEIPVTKLFGRSPAGMNATGEADMRNYYERIARLQERMLRPALERLLPVMAVSEFGYLPEDLRFVFNPLATMTPEQKEELAEKLHAWLPPTTREFSH